MSIESETTEAGPPPGIRVHPPFAARILMPVGSDMDIVSIYAHDKRHLDEVVMRLWMPKDRVLREQWSDEQKKWIDG